MRPQLKKGIALTIAIALWLVFTILNIWDIAILGQVFEELGQGSVQHKFWYSAVLAGFFLANFLFFREVFGRIDKLDVLTLLWRLFIIGMVGITLTLILIVVNRLTANTNISIYLHPIFYSINIYILTVFFLSATFIYRRFILYQKTRLKIFGLNAFWFFLGLAILFSFGVFSQPLGGLFFGVAVALFTLLCLFLSVNVSWTAYLNFNQKLKALGLFSLIIVVIVTYAISLKRLPEEFDLMVINTIKYSFLNGILLFSAIYSGISILVLFFNLPTSSVFEARSSEIASFNKINQAIQSNLDFTDILQTLLNASMLIANAKTGWVEVLSDGDPQAGVFKTGKGITDEETKVLKRGFDITEKVNREGKYYLVRNTRRHRAFRNAQSKFKSLLCVPIISPNNKYGAIFVVKELTNAFEDVSIQSIKGFADQAGAALENAQLIKNSIELERYQEQLKIAKEVQKQLLPQELPVSDKVEFVAMSDTAEEVGGDYYDIVQNGDDLFKIAIGDVSGKGTTAAFYMAEVKGIFHALTQMDTGVCKFMVYANQAVSKCLQRGFFMTLTYLHVDIKKQTVELVRAGHAPAFYYNAAEDKLKMLRDGIPGLGIVRDQSYSSFLTETTCLNYKPGDFMVLYTDGITEARNREGEEFGYERLSVFIESHKYENATNIADGLMTEVRQFSDAKMYDDHTILIIKFL